jgi:uncharacterized protein YbjT (DUF2867 family)
VLGRRVVDRLRAAGRDPWVLSRSGRADTVRADVLTGAGPEEPVDGIKTLIHWLPILLVPKGFVWQPRDAGEVADRLIELAFSSPSGRVPDVGGPEVLTAGELARASLETVGHRKRLVEVPVPGKAARDWREGAQLYPEQA